MTLKKKKNSVVKKIGSALTYEKELWQYLNTCLSPFAQQESHFCTEYSLQWWKITLSQEFKVNKIVARSQSLAFQPKE